MDRSRSSIKSTARLNILKALKSRFYMLFSIKMTWCLALFSRGTLLLTREITFSCNSSHAWEVDVKKLNIIAEWMSSEIPKRRQRDMSFAVHLSDATWRRGWIYCLARLHRFVPIHVARAKRVRLHAQDVDRWKTPHIDCSSAAKDRYFDGRLYKTYRYKERGSCKHALWTSCKIHRVWKLIFHRVLNALLFHCYSKCWNVKRLLASLLLLLFILYNCFIIDRNVRTSRIFALYTSVFVLLCILAP